MLSKQTTVRTTAATTTVAEPTTVSAALTSLLSGLVRFPTVATDHAANAAALDWVQEQLAGLPLYITRYESNGHHSLVATTRDTKKPKLWLNGHIDVVFAPLESFVPTIKDGRLYGRGTHDMKAGVAVFIALLQSLGDQLAGYDLGLMLTTDEELGGTDGAKMLLEAQGYSGEVALIPDSGAAWTMEMGAKGISWWELISSGRSAHAGRLWHGENAIDKLTQFVEHLRTHIPSEPCGDPDHQHSTLNLAALNGGASTNQVPASATARIDIRFTTDTTLEDLTSWMDEASKAIPGVEAVMQFTDTPYKVRDEGPVHRFREFVQEVTGHDVTLAHSHGTSDARHFAHCGISTINISPIGSGFHVPEEWVDLEDLNRFYEVVRRFVDDTAKV